MDDGFRIVDAFIQDDYIIYLMMDFMIWIWIGQFDLQRILTDSSALGSFFMDSGF
jgi:hypothetical protein